MNKDFWESLDPSLPRIRPEWRGPYELWPRQRDITPWTRSEAGDWRRALGAGAVPYCPCMDDRPADCLLHMEPFILDIARRQNLGTLRNGHVCNEPRGLNYCGWQVGLKIGQWTTQPEWRRWCQIMSALYVLIAGIVLIFGFSTGHIH